jgi:hypothetical protein
MYEILLTGARKLNVLASDIIDDKLLETLQHGVGA